MVKRVCLFCGMPCYSADDRGDWVCPRCEKTIPKEEANANEGPRTAPRPHPTDAAD